MDAQFERCRTGRQRQPKLLWSLAGLVLAVLVAVLVPVGQIRLGGRQLQGLVGSYFYYAEPVPTSMAVVNQRVTGVYWPAALRIEWDYQPSSAGLTPGFKVERWNGSSMEASWYTGDYFLLDTTPATFTPYEYRIYVMFENTHPNPSVPEESLLPPPIDANPDEVYRYPVPDMTTYVTLHATIEDAAVTDNQTVDSRLDLRYATTHYRDYQFGTKTYRGGLFAGHATDPSRVGRSFLRFNIGSLPSGAALWEGATYTYFTRAATDGYTTVGCLPADDTWSAANLKWTSAPTLDLSQIDNATTIPWDDDHRDPRWVRFLSNLGVYNGLTTTGHYSAALAASNEATNGWAYFAKKEFDSSYAAHVIYAYGDPLSLLSVTVDATELSAGDTATGTVVLSACALPGGYTIPLTVTGSDPSALIVPATVTVLPGHKTAHFTVTGGTVSTPTTCFIGQSAVVVISP